MSLRKAPTLMCDIEQGMRAEGSASAADAVGVPGTSAPSPNGLRLRRAVTKLLATERDKEGWSTQKGKRANKQKTPAGRKRDEEEYDVFLSYRVQADMKLVETIYWRLVGSTITVNGTQRKMRVFWDKKCLLSGESWEAGFSRAICSSTVIVAVMSREALASVANLKSDSPCDNVVLEYALALALAEMKNTAIFPLFVGDKVKNDDAGLGQQITSLEEQVNASATPGQDLQDTEALLTDQALLTDLKKRYAALDERYTHYFQSGCNPTPLPEVRVREIDEKWATYVGEAKEALSLDDVDIRPRTVQEIMSGMTASQGHFLMGPASDAVDAAVASIHKCAQRVVEEQASSRLVEGLQFSTPQGQEVLEWLAERMVSQYSHVFARNKLDSLRKVSRLSAEQISKLNDEFCRGLHGASEAQIGGHIRIADAVASLQGDPRTKSISDRLASFRDSAAENAAAEKRLAWVLDVLGVVIGATVLFALGVMGLPLHQALASRPHSVTSFSVQLSVDGNNWTNVMCPWGKREQHSEGQGQKCVFDASPEQSSVVTHWFPQAEEGRYLRLLPRTWENKQDGTGADLRLDIMYSPEEIPNLGFAVMQGGQPGQAWLQAGCNKDGAPAGAWVAQDSDAGLVQCCLDAPGVHVCTRDGCLAGDAGAGAEAKVSWGEAKVRCEARGWRLCTRQELDRKASSGCCGSGLAGTNRCGYDSELVWTNNTGGADPLDRLGRLHSDTAFENVRQVGVELLGMRRVDGVSVQGGAAAASGITCLYFTWGLFLLPFALQLLVMLLQLLVGLTTPLAATVKAWGRPLSWMLPAVLGIVVTAVDPSVPSVSSGNPVCTSQGMQVRGVFVAAWILVLQWLWHIGYLTLCPQIPAEYASVTVIAPLWGGLILVLASPADNEGPLGTIATGIRFLGYFLFACPFIWDIPRKYLFDRRSKAQAREKMAKDVVKYNEAWEAAGGVRGAPRTGASPSNRVGDGGVAAGEDTDVLATIKNRCSGASSGIREKRARAVAQMSLVNRLMFRIGAGPRSWQHQSRYARTGKYRQRSRDADTLFEEAATLNDQFLSMIDDKLSHLAGSKGMIRGPLAQHRALTRLTIHTNTHTHTNTFIYMCVHICNTHTHTHTYTHTHTHSCVCIHLHMHMNRHNSRALEAARSCTAKGDAKVLHGSALPYRPRPRLRAAWFPRGCRPLSRGHSGPVRDWIARNQVGGGSGVLHPRCGQGNQEPRPRGPPGEKARVDDHEDRA